ncbi:MAG: PadR family transcriptional regulator [Gemmatimonadetes bacterium]|nr:PadR family transcriptional regulator [Gemmatimonadota bacterium]
MPRNSLGEFEKLVLLALLRLGPEAYGAQILEELEERAQVSTSSGALYVALRRLERRGLVSSRLGDPTPERGGRAKRYFKIESPAIRALRTTHARWRSLAEGIENLLES